MLKFAVKRKPVELFHEAVHCKDVLRVTFLLEQNESQFHIDDIDEDGITALQRSCFTGTLKLVQLLVTYGADINIQDKEGWSVMHAATVARNHSIMRYLIAMGAPLGLENDQGEQAIDLARDLQSVMILAEGMRHAGLARDVEDYLRRRPEVREVLEEKIQSDREIEQERQRAASDILPSNMSLLNLDSEQKRRSSADNPRPPTANVKSNDNDLEKLMDTQGLMGVALPTGNFLESSLNWAGLEAGGRQSCALCPKCGKRRRQFVKRQSTVSLCSDSSDSSTSSDSAYSSGSTNSAVNLYSVEYGYVGTITTAKQNNDYLSAENNRVQEDRVRALSMDPSLECGNYPTNDEIEQGEPLNTQRRTPNNSFYNQGRYSSAINNIYTKTGKFPDHRRVIQTTAYQFSPRRYSSPILISRTSDENSAVSRAPIASAIEEPTNVNQLNSRGVSLLHEAAAKGDAEGVKLLLLHGAEVNRQSLNGSSPLHEAVSEGNAVTASILIKHGADLFTETDNGLLPVDLAPDPEMKKFIENAMALK